MASRSTAAPQSRSPSPPRRHRPGRAADDLPPLRTGTRRQDPGGSLRRDQRRARSACGQHRPDRAADLTFPGRDGNFGPLDLDVGFKPPNGIGLSLDGGGFKGGGFLYLDTPKGEYAGTLELSFQGIVDVRAVGILNTKLPDGQPGFSLLILISAEFTPIQLSFGFTLIGVGGLIGLNRTILFDPLRAGVRDGSLNSVLFPRDVVANAPRIIGDLKRIFPPLDGRFLIGPMAKLGWGRRPSSASSLV